MTKKSLWDAIDVTATVCLTVASVALLWDLVAGPLYSVPTVPGALVASGMVVTDLEPGSVLAIDESSRGLDEARVALIEFSDFECPYCAAFASSTLSVIRARYIDTGRVAFVYRHMPSERLHPHAMARPCRRCWATIGRTGVALKANNGAVAAEVFTEMLDELLSHAARGDQ